VTHTVAAENFSPDYLKINPHGTVPSLVVPTLDQPLIDSRDILEYLDNVNKLSLTPQDATLKATVEKVVALVHFDDVHRNLILLQARDTEEYEKIRTGIFGAFIATRQEVLEKFHSAHPEHPFYGPKVAENGALNRIYTTGPSAERDAFSKKPRRGIFD
jgi:glutathione S-transferase